MTEAISPSEALSEEVVDRLIKAGLIRADKRDGINEKIASGHMQGADWKLEIELARAKSVAKSKTPVSHE